MDNGLFRRKTLDKVSSPEQMNDYIRVTSPGVWLVLAAVIALLAGLIIWSALGRLETTVTAVAVAGSDGNPVCYIAEDDMDAVRAGQTVHIGGKIIPFPRWRRSRFRRTAVSTHTPCMWAVWKRTGGCTPPSLTRLFPKVFTRRG